MAKSISTLCLLLVLIYVRLNGTIASSNSKKYTLEGIECPKGFPPSVCGKNTLFPFPRTGRSDPTFVRSQRIIGILKQPRVGRSDPLMPELDGRRIHNAEDTWIDGNSPGLYHHRALGEKEENLRNFQNYLSAQRRDSISPWAFFLITPNFQNSDQQSGVDNLAPQLGYEMGDVNEE